MSIERAHRLDAELASEKPDEKVWALRLLWQRRSYVKERRRAASQDTVPVPEVA